MEKEKERATCRYCDPDSTLVLDEKKMGEIFGNTVNMTAVVDKENSCIAIGAGMSYTMLDSEIRIRIRFCPMCGRRL